jgi:hypothetical protein
LPEGAGEDWVDAEEGMGCLREPFLLKVWAASEGEIVAKG